MGFSKGILTYWAVLRFAERLGVHSASLQTIGWFAATMVGVGIVTGEIGRWTRPNQAIAVLVVLGIGWLLVNAGTG